MTSLRVTRLSLAAIRASRPRIDGGMTSGRRGRFGWLSTNRRALAVARCRFSVTEGVRPDGDVATGWSAIDVKPPRPWWGWMVVAPAVGTFVAALSLLRCWRKSARKYQELSRLPP